MADEKSVSFEIPFPVSVNQLYSSGLTRRHKSKKAVEWVKEAGSILASMKIKPIHGPLKVVYEFQEGRDNRRRDAFNFEKILTDLLVDHGVIEADHDLILREGTVKWSRDVTGVRVTITPIERNIND